MGEKNNLDEYVKKETLLIVAVVALITGFLAGVIVTAYKSRSELPSHACAPPHQKEQAEKKQVVPTELAVKIFELEKQLSQSPDDFDQWLPLGNLYFDIDNHDKAIMAYNKYLEHNQDNADVLADLGVMYRRSGQHAEAIKAFDRAIKADPSHEVARFNKGIVLMHDLNNIEGAIKEWEDLAAMNPAAVTPGGQSVAALIERFKQAK